MNRIVVYSFLLGFCGSTLAKNKTDTYVSTFGEVGKNVGVYKVENNANFLTFLKKFKGETLKKVGSHFLGYYTRNSVHVFDTASNQVTTLSFGKMNRTDRIQCFSFDSKYFYVKFRKCIRVFNKNGDEITTYNINNKEIYGMDLYTDRNYVYLVSHNKDFLGFRFDEIEQNLKLIFHNNDFYSSRTDKFSFVIGDDIYILVNKRFSVVNKKSGVVVKNVYLDTFFDNLKLFPENAFLYSKNRFVLVNLRNFSLTYNNQIELCAKPLIMNGEAITYNGKTYRGDYIYTYFFSNAFFRYSQNTYDSHCFLIKKDKVTEFVLENFAITHVFEMGRSILLVDCNARKIKLV